jgi:eukaryotic-like serine/threonine-protein kinase
MGLSTQEMARLSELLDQALPLTPTGRRRWLAALPPEDHPLLHALRDSLTGEDPESDLQLRLENPARIDGGAEEPARPARQPGERLGAYELLRLLGIGGMAEVWLARRADGVFDRHVALKIPRLGRVPQEMAERFARERRILAVLECPGIARLYDAGVDDLGVPYFAMEYVQGETLTAWCTARSLETAERLQLFLQVLEAVSHAHAQHVVHRDLKPSNILVTAQGEVRLLDFGVARLLQEDTGAPALTRQYGRPLTPEYASPELLHGDGIDARSDIYSLGIVLHELLLGRRPAQQGSGTDALPPLPADLLDIVRRAIATLPDDRYPDVAAFAAALRPHASKHAAYRVSLPSLRHGLTAAVALALLATGALAYRHFAPALPPAPPVPPLPAAPVASATIAVLPFVDLSENHDQGYLSDGLAEELLNLLTKIPDLHVTARGSSFAFRDRRQDVTAIARQLNVAHILDGSVRRSGDRLRFSVQLVQASTGNAIWSETYDRELEDVFDVQEDVANAVVSALKLRLLDKQSIPPSLRTQNTRAYEEYLLGRQFRDGYTLDRQRRSLAAFQRAVELDPSFAAARAAVAMVTADIGAMTMDRSLYEVATEEAERALELEPDLVEAHVARARVRMEGEWDFEGARMDLEAASRIDPNNAALLQMRAYYLSVTGKPEDALPLERRAVERNPLAANLWDGLAASLINARDYAGARQALDRAEQLSPYSDYRHQLRTRIELYAGNYEAALKLARSNPDTSQRDYNVSLAAYSAGHAAEGNAALERLIERVPDTYTVQIAMAYAWRGQRDEAFEWLDRAIEIHDPGLMEIRNMREFDRIRADPRFTQVLAQMNLAD